MSLRSRRFASLLVGGCALALACSSASAHAGRASACKAPPFSVPKETQRAVDAAIDARITGAGAGGASSTVAVRTDYETTTLSQDAAARAWFEFTLCNKLAKKLISQELHDELLRSLLAPQAQLPMLAETAPPQVIKPPEAVVTEPPGLQDPEQLVGTWTVTSRFQWSTCAPPNDIYGSYAYTWLIGTDKSGEVRVDVAGTTAFPSMTGRVRGGALLLEGTRGGSAPTPEWTIPQTGGLQSELFGVATVALVPVGGTLRGTRDVIMFDIPQAGGSANAPAALRPCQVRFEVEATR